MTDYILRFFIGGVVVSLFSVIGDVLRPKSFAGLFGAAPSIALATLGLTIHRDGANFAALEARSMVLGAIAFFVYASITSIVIRRFRPSVLAATASLLPVWFAVAFCMWALAIRNH